MDFELQGLPDVLIRPIADIGAELKSTVTLSMPDEPESRFATLKEATSAGKQRYNLRLEERNWMVTLANHLAKRKAAMPRNVRMKSWLEEPKRATDAL